MKNLALIAAMALCGCAHVNGTIATMRDPNSQAARDYSAQRSYNVCMKQTLGNFADFKPTEARLKASEQCKSVMQASTPTPSP